MLHRAGLDALAVEDDRVVIGAMVPIAALVDAPDDALAEVARAHRRQRGAPERDRRRQPLRRRPAADAQRGDLGAPLIALGARVRSTGAGGERIEPIEDFLAGDRGRPARARGRVRPLRPAHRRCAGCGAGTRTRTRSPASSRAARADGSDLRVARQRRRPDGRSLPHGRAEPRRRRRARRTSSRSTTQSPPAPTAAACCRNSSVKPSTNWSAHEADRQRCRGGRRQRAADSAPARPARRARHHEPESRLPAGRLRCVHRARRRRAAALVPDRGRAPSTARRSRPSRVSPPPGRSRPCRRPSTITTPRSAASARRAW